MFRSSEFYSTSPSPVLQPGALFDGRGPNMVDLGLLLYDSVSDPTKH